MKPIMPWFLSVIRTQAAVMTQLMSAKVATAMYRLVFNIANIQQPKPAKRASLAATRWKNSRIAATKEKQLKQPISLI